MLSTSEDGCDSRGGSPEIFKQNFSEPNTYVRDPIASGGKNECEDPLKEMEPCRR
jgi:hypothetical protein